MITNLRLINLLLPLLALVLAVAVWLQVDDWQRLTRQVKQNEVKLQQLQLGASRFVSVQASTKKSGDFLKKVTHYKLGLLKRLAVTCCNRPRLLL